jgi:HD-GYP domain-containing protein (c-di-GMP phosphodiesterase class II)
VPRVLEELDRLCGKQFDPELVKAFVGTECYKNLGEDAAEESAP